MPTKSQRPGAAGGRGLFGSLVVSWRGETGGGAVSQTAKSVTTEPGLGSASWPANDSVDGQFCAIAMHMVRRSASDSHAHFSPEAHHHQLDGGVQNCGAGLGDGVESSAKWYANAANPMEKNPGVYLKLHETEYYTH